MIKNNNNSNIFDFRLTYPSLVVDNDEISNKNNDNNILIDDNNDNKKPIIILLGWAGCQDRYLAKYSAIYEERRLVYI